MNTIVDYISDFLKEYAPFNYLSTQELLEIAIDIRVISLEKNQKLFQINDTLHDSFYLVSSGVINLSVFSDAEETSLNKCRKGDVFGLRPFFAKNNYMMTATATEESVVYAIPIVSFKPFVNNNPEVLNFLLESFATNMPYSKDRENLKGRLISDSYFYSNQQSDIQYFKNLSYSLSPLIVAPTNSIKDVARAMTEDLASNAIVAENNLPIGVVTSQDMCTKVATGYYLITDEVKKIMVSPVVTVIENVSLAEAQLMMLKNNVSYLCVTVDGTIQSSIRGIISEHDLIIAQSSNPGVLIKEIKRAKNVIELKHVREKLTDLIQNSINKNLPLSHISNIANEINIAIIKRAVELGVLEIGTSPVRFAWLSIGSQARKEQLLMTDQDSVLVFNDVEPEKYRDVKDYFIRLGKKVNGILAEIGFIRCQNKHTTENPLWIKSISEWIQQYNVWLNVNQKTMESLSGIFFDYQMVFGDAEIEESIENNIFANLKNRISLFDFLGNDALKKNTPLSFFKNFILEEDGENKDKFDIKTKAIMPLVDGARLFSLSHELRGVNNTYLRFKQLAILDPKHAEVYLDCAEAFLVLTKIRTLNGLKHSNSGQYIDLAELSKVEKENFKNALNPMKELEELIKDKFQLTQFS